MSDEKNLLVNAQNGRTKAMRQWRFLSKTEIDAALIKAYVKEAVELQRKGFQIKPDRNRPLILPAQLEEALSKNEKAHACFKELSKAMQR